MKVTKALRDAVAQRKFERTKIGELSVAEFREVMAVCLHAHDIAVEGRRQRAGLSSGWEAMLLANADRPGVNAMRTK